jgi:hypothetical protein
MKQAIAEWYVLNMLEITWGGLKQHTTPPAPAWTRSPHENLRSPADRERETHPGHHGPAPSRRDPARGKCDSKTVSGASRLRSPPERIVMALTCEDRAAITEMISLHGHLCDSGELERLDEVLTASVIYDLTDFGQEPLEGVGGMRGGGACAGRA